MLFGLLTAFSSLMPSKVRISRAIDINSSSNIILEEIKDMTKWEQWNEYTKALTGKKISSDNIHSLLLSVSLVSSDSTSVTTSWQQPNKNAFPGIFNILPGKNHSTIQWYFEFSLKWYPWEKFGSIIYDKELGPEMEKSLQNLKELLEKGT